MRIVLLVLPGLLLVGSWLWENRRAQAGRSDFSTVGGETGTEQAVIVPWQRPRPHTDALVASASRAKNRAFRLVGLPAIAFSLVTAVLILMLTVGPRTGMYGTYAVLTQSMEPGIPQGSVVVVRPVAPSQLHVGDVITFSSSGPPYETLTHRIASVERDGETFAFQTKGDANLLADPWKVVYQQRAGMVQWVVPLAGYALMAASTAPVRLGLGIGFVGALSAGWLALVWRRPRPIAVPARATPVVRRGEVSGYRVAIFAWLIIWLLLLSGGQAAVRRALS